MLLERLLPNCDPGWQPTLHFLKQDWPDLSSLGQALLTENIISAGAEDALLWLTQHLGQDHRIDLSGRKVVIFGASAEMAPTAQFSAAGAEILWLDLTPPTELTASQFRGGGLQFPTGGVNLLTQPAETLATILAFADTEPLDLCLYAYAPGQAREMRLTAGMNAIVNALPNALVRSITLLLSPTTATPLIPAQFGKRYSMGWAYSAVVVAPSYRDRLAPAVRWLEFKARAIRPPSIWPN